MVDTRLNAELRTEFGKGASRRNRAAGKIPAVLYGHGTDPIHLILPAHETELAMRISNALLELHVGEEEPKLALTKDIQRNPVKNKIVHVDLQLVRRGEKVLVDVPVVVVGDAVPDAIVMTEVTTLEVHADVTNIPNDIEVSVEGLEIGAQILAGEVKLPEGVEIACDPEMLVVNVAAPISEAALEAELEVGEAEEPEVVSEEGEGDEEEAEEGE